MTMPSLVTASAPPAEPLISLTAVDKTYVTRGAQTCHAVTQLTLQVGKGEYVAVLGKSGSGKSTLLNLIAGLDRASGGKVRVAGTSLEGMSESRMAAWRGRHIGVVFQFFQLLPTLTTAENIILAIELVGGFPSNERRERALHLLQQVGLADQADKLPSTLSGGQQQRAAIARALANDPPIILADEPTGNLDTGTAAEINTLFQRLAAEGKTLFVVTHDASLAGTAHRVIELRDGAIIADRYQRVAA